MRRSTTSRAAASPLAAVNACCSRTSLPHYWPARMRAGITTAIETAGNVPGLSWKRFCLTLTPSCTITSSPIPSGTRNGSGVDNSRILANFRKAYETFPDKTFIARTPLIPGVNDDEEHIRSVLAFIRPYKNVVDYELLPYHRFGENKYEFLGRVYELEDFKPPSQETLPG